MYEEIMNISIEYGTESIDWLALCEIFRLAPLGTREPEKLKIAAENSHTLCSAYVDQKIIGFGRAISDSQYQSTLKSIPELSDLPRKERGKLWRKNCLNGLIHWQTLCALGVHFIWSFIIFTLIQMVRQKYPTINVLIYSIANSIFGFGIGFYFFMVIWVEQVRPYIKQQRNQ